MQGWGQEAENVLGARSWKDFFCSQAVAGHYCMWGNYSQPADTSQVNSLWIPTSEALDQLCRNGCFATYQAAVRLDMWAGIPQTLRNGILLFEFEDLACNMYDDQYCLLHPEAVKLRLPAYDWQHSLAFLTVRHAL